MFDLIRDIYLEASGIDSKAVAEQRKARRAEKRSQYILFSTGTKIIVWILGIIYLIIAGAGIAGSLSSGAASVPSVLRFIFLSGCDIAVLVCLSIKKKQAEIAALILIGVFAFTQYITVVFF